MDQLQHFLRTSRAYSYVGHMLVCMVMIGTWLLTSQVGNFDTLIIFLILLAEGVILPALVAWVMSELFIQPVKVIWQAILYMSPETTRVPAPDLKRVKYAHALAENLVGHVYKLAEVSQHVAKTSIESAHDIHANFVAASLPLPLVILDKDENILFANPAMLTYLQRVKDDTEGQNVHSVLDLSFRTDQTLESWLKNTKENTATATQTWNHARITLRDDKSTVKYCDLVAYYNQSNTWGFETMLVLFDRTVDYKKEEQALSYVALAVHELRTPLTMMRGYIEALNEDLAGKIGVEQAKYLQRTQVAAGQLATFTNNILNVARVDDDQMVFTLQEEKWQDVLASTLNDLALRASIHGITIKTSIAPDLPTVGIDHVSMYEVVSNLIDNAIKYSLGKGKEIIVSARLHDNMVETTVQDFGVGVPESAVPHLFTKFYRDHHNKVQVTGTGIGLYLCKTFIEAHGGNIWVRSKEGEGATFGFTLIPYANLAEEKKNNDNKDVTRSAHGWIKNHSLYRR